MKKISLILMATMVLCCSCGGSSSNNSSSYDGNYSDDYKDEGSNDLYEYVEEPVQTMYLCPMCQGNKQILHYYTGEIMVCPACEGAGLVTTEVIQQLQEAVQMGEDLANDVINGGTSNGYSNGSFGNDIEYELEQLEREKASLEDQLSYVESVTSRAYLSSRLTEVNTRIRQLQRQMQYAE